MDGDPYVSLVQKVAYKKPVLFSTMPVSTSELDDLVGSAHIGIALYSLKELGYRAELMGLAAGKIGNYLKCGLPVIATSVSSIQSYVEKYQCGVCVNSANEVRNAVEKILSDYEAYSSNALACYDELWSPDKYCSIILSRINKLCKTR